MIFALPLGSKHHSFRPPTDQPRFKMSKHNSLKSNATVGGKRSVLKRFERVKLLKERGEWKQGKSPIGLPKTKHEG
jgi:small basic protein (TIGR04137 family)